MTQTSRISADWLEQASSQRVIAALEAKRPDCARFVGGCVRNTLMRREVDDIDIATQLTPDEVLEALAAAGIRAEPTGIEHGTITAIEDHIPFEITSLRRDVETDGRRAVVAFTTEWAEDAQRRDFRLNAIYAGPDGTLYDPTNGGLADAATGKVIFIGDGDQRLKEDYLRILRFFRFNAWYGAGIDQEGLAACQRQAIGLRKIAVERIWREMHKLLRAPKLDQTIAAMDTSGVLDEILPRRRDGTASDHILQLQMLEAASGTKPDAYLRLMALLPREPSLVGQMADHLRLPNDDKARLLAWASPDISETNFVDDKAVRASLYQHGRQTLMDWAIYKLDSNLAERLQTAEEPKQFPIQGRDLLQLGLKPGPEVGKILRALEADWIKGDFSADRDALLAQVKAGL